jgi:hypothetical protein
VALRRRRDRARFQLTACSSVKTQLTTNPTFEVSGDAT